MEFNSQPAKNTVYTCNFQDESKKFLQDIINALQYKNDFRYFFLGSFNGRGLSPHCLLILHFLLRGNRGLRAHIISKDLDQSLLIKDVFIRLFGDSFYIKDIYNKGQEIYIEYNSGSFITLISEDSHLYSDFSLNKKLNNLETDIIWLNRINELQKATFMRSQERVGNRGNQGKLPGIILSTYYHDMNGGWFNQDVIDNPISSYNIYFDKTKGNSFIVNDENLGGIEGMEQFFCHGFEQDQYVKIGEQYYGI